MKLKINRLKVAQISREQLLPQIRYYCLEHPAFVDTLEDMEDVFCHANIFDDFKDRYIDLYNDFPPKEIDTVLTDLRKQFCSYDYIMLI